MKYIRLLKMDLRYCKKRILIGLGISVILVLFLCGGYETSVRFGIRQQGISSTGSVMNVLAYLLAGTEYIPSTEIRIPELPLRWCIIYVYGLYLLSDFPFRMKEKIGSAQILALRSQTGWWLEKLFWTFLVAIGYLITVTLTIILFCVWRDIPLNLKMNQEVFAWMYPSIQGTVPTEFFWIFGLIISPANYVFYFDFIADSDGSAAWPRRRLLHECLSDSSCYGISVRFADSESGNGVQGSISCKNRCQQKGRPNGSYGSGSYQSAFVGIGNPCKRKPSKREGKYMSLKKLEVHHATKRIHGNTVLQDISCTFLSGKIYGLKGINGSGKTMFMRLLCGLIRPSEGEIFYDEKKLGTDFRFPPGVGILLENPSFLDSCTGLQNLKMIADINQKITEKEIRNTLFRVGLDPDDQRKYKKYSSGNETASWDSGSCYGKTGPAYSG